VGTVRVVEERRRAFGECECECELEFEVGRRPCGRDTTGAPQPFRRPSRRAASTRPIIVTMIRARVSLTSTPNEKVLVPGLYSAAEPLANASR
jgi:hypothetical protein